MTPAPEFTLVALDEVDSTNSEARLRAQNGAADGTVIWAKSQSAGRGRRGRQWSSPQGNLYLSIIVRPNRKPSEAAQLSLVAAVALVDTLEAVMPDAARIRCKWPNDVLVNGRKTAGILLESAGGAETTEWVVIGCGVNIASHPQADEYPTTDLAAEGADGITVETVRDSFIANFLSWRRRWLENGIAPVRAAWIAKAARLGETITVRLPDREFSGRFVDMDAGGALLLELPNGDRKSITAGDVFL